MAPIDRRRTQRRRQVILFTVALAIVATAVPTVTALVEILEPPLRQLRGGSGGTSGLAQSPLTAAGGGSRGGAVPAGAFPFDPAVESSFARRLGTVYHYNNERPPALRYMDAAASRLAREELELSVNGAQTPRLLLGLPYRAELRLSLSQALAELKQELAADAQGRRHLKELTTVVEATLEGGSFLISPEAPRARTVTGQRDLVWSWRVEPRTPGEQSLTARVTARFILSGVEYAEPIASVETFVSIRRSPWAPLLRFFTTAGVWLLAAAVASISAVIIRRCAKAS